MQSGAVTSSVISGQGFEYEDSSTWPEITDDVRLDLSARYIDLYERVTGEQFTLPKDPDILSRIAHNLEAYNLKNAPASV